MNLLIVNDDVVITDSMKNDITWSEHGINQVWAAYDAQTGKDIMNERKIDILLCDIEMPGENGIALLRWVRQEQKETECIFLTCHASFEYAQEAISLGCQNYLILPARYEDIIEAVCKVAGKLRADSVNRQYQEYGRMVIQEKKERAIETFGQKKSTGEVVQEAVDFIMKNLDNEELSVNEVADKLYLHPVYLNRIFKKEKDVSVGQFISTERMKLAGELLRDGSLSAYAVAEQIGYPTYSNFNRMFRKYYGCSPSQFVKKDE